MTAEEQAAHKDTAKKVRIGDLLIQNKLLTNGQLELAPSEQRSQGRKVGQIVVSLGFVSEERSLRIISQQLNVPYVDLNQYRYEKEVVALLSEAHSKRLRAIPIGRRGEALLSPWRTSIYWRLMMLSDF